MIALVAFLFALVVSCAMGFRLPATAFGRLSSSSSSSSSSVAVRRQTTELFGARNRAWAKGDLSDKDIFEGVDDETNLDKKVKTKLEPETVFYEGGPSSSEVVLPALSIFTVIGIVPFISAVARQAWVRYKFTSRRISIQSGIGGKEQTEIIYPDGEQTQSKSRAMRCDEMT